MSEEKINKVAIVAKSAQQKSAQVLKESQLGHQQKCNQLDQLIAFKQEYETKLQAIGGRGIAARQLQDYRLFLSKLGQAIDQQTETVQLSLESLGSVREQWLLKSQHSSSLDKLLDQRRVKARQAIDKAEQKESDERSMFTGLTRSEP